MGAWKLCPVCRQEKIRRMEVHTCGAPSCRRTWRISSLEARARMREEAELYAAHWNEPPTAWQLKQGIPPPEGFENLPPLDPLPEEEQLSPSTRRDNEFLEKMFGPDAPGVVKPDKK